MLISTSHIQFHITGYGAMRPVESHRQQNIVLSDIMFLADDPLNKISSSGKAGPLLNRMCPIKADSRQGGYGAALP